MDVPTDDAKIIADNAMELVTASHRFGIDKPIRMITVGTYGLIFPSEASVQDSVFDEPVGKSAQINEKLDNLRKKYGYGILKRGVEINPSYVNQIKELEDGYIPFDRNNAKEREE